LPALADGEQRNFEVGTRWVDPVEFYELQDINRTDFQRDYDQGDIDFNKVVKDKGLKVYGLRLKPFCGATYVEKFAYITELDGVNPDFQFDFQDLYGVRGIPLNEAGFCIYVDEGVSRSYDFTYKWKSHHPEVHGVCEHWKNNTSTSSLNISNLRLSSTENSLDVCYSFTAHEHLFQAYRNYCHDIDENPEDNGTLEHDYDFSKSDGANHKLGHFIYFRGARDLILMVGCDAMSLAKHMKASEIPLLQRPWPRVYFFVEEILVEDDGGPILSEEDRQELVNYLDGLTAWLSGEGDPLGLGEHTDATTSAVIGAIGTVASILLGNGLAGMLGGSAGSLVDTLINSATSGANPLPGSDAPDLTKMEGLKGRKPEDENDNENENENEPPPPPEEKLEFLDKYTRVDSDGDFWVRDPVTGKETLYTNNGDGTYRNFNTDQDWRPEEINEHLRYRDENSNPLKQDAETAARNAAEQHAQWEKESKELSQEGKDYLKWKHEQEAAEKKQAEIERLARKYGVPPTEKAVTNAIKYEMAIAQIDHDVNQDLANQYDKGIETLGVIDKTCEIGVNVMATCVPGGEAVKDAYTFAKATLVAASEAVNEGKSLGEGLAHVAVGMGNGALGVIQNQASNLAGEGKYAWVKELGINVATEDLKEGMNAYYQTGDLAKARDAMLQATGKKTAEFGVSKLISYGTGKLKESATNALAGGESKMSEGMAKKVDYWFNKTHTGYLGHRADVFKVKVDGQNFSVGKGQGFSIFYSGAIDTGKLTEGVINETLNQTGAHDWAGNLVQGANDLGVEAAANVAYGAGVVNDSIVNFAKDVKDFSNLAAKFGKK
ncbi:MAG: hypothetical protein IKH47_02740, partial [Bacteroidaceae bacterium]|nr:hypothetical protein [Bacteroidaceae bacterium]